MLPSTRSIVVFLSLVQFIGFGINQNVPSSSQRSSISTPTKARAIEILRDFLAAYNNKDMKKMASVTRLRRGHLESIERDREAVGGGRINISAGGIDTIAKKGTWGKVRIVLASESYLREVDHRQYNREMDSLIMLAKDLEISLDDCYVITYKQYEVIYYWDGARLRIIKWDEIEELENQ
jgi:hypothetical protein